MKDHEIRELVSQLTEVAEQYGQTQQLRERIRGVVFPFVGKLQDRDTRRVSMKEGFDAQRQAGINVDWFTWQIAWQDALIVRESEKFTST